MTSMTRAMTTVVLGGALLFSGCRADKKADGKAAAPPAASKPAAEPAQPAQPAPAAADAKLLAEGTMAPDVTGKAFDGTEVSLAKLRGKPVVLYFYPKDDTPGCTVEAQSFRDDSADFTALGAVVIGVSMDTLDSHKAFTDKYQLNFPLLSDPDGAIAAKFGVDTSRGVAKRTTFVIGKDGKIVKVFADVHVQGHSDEVLAAVKQAAGA